MLTNAAALSTRSVRSACMTAGMQYDEPGACSTKVTLQAAAAGQHRQNHGHLMAGRTFEEAVPHPGSIAVDLQSQGVMPYTHKSERSSYMWQYCICMHACNAVTAMKYRLLTWPHLGQPVHSHQIRLLLLKGTDIYANILAYSQSLSDQGPILLAADVHGAPLHSASWDALHITRLKHMRCIDCCMCERLADKVRLIGCWLHPRALSYCVIW